MSIMNVFPAIEKWLDADAESWSPLSDQDYVALVRQWRNDYMPLIAGGEYVFQAGRAIHAFEGRLPTNVWLFSGVHVPELANMGGSGAAGYQAVKLRSLRRELASELELIVVACDLSWSCVFSHETWEQLYERKG